ncbi:MAG: sporulation transcription factor Spo0A [Christensenellales bacterium]
MDKIRIILIDDNEVYVNGLARYLERRPEFCVIGAYSNPTTGFKALLTQECDICLLDVIMPVLDGIAIIEKLNIAPIAKKPKIITLSAVRNDAVLHRLLELGASYCIVKPCEPNIVAKRILSIAGHEADDGYISGSSDCMPQPSLSQHVMRLLNQVGMQHNLKGHKYLMEAIKMAVENNGELKGMTLSVYPEIAKKFNTEPSRVERAMRHAIETAWNRGPIENKNQLFGYTINAQKGKPTNSEFIAMLSDKIMIEGGHR